MTRSGLSASARAMPMRCRWPPLNSCGYRDACDAFSPTSVSRSLMRCRRSSPPPPTPWNESTSDRMRAHRHARVERRVRVLEHDLHPLPERAHRGPVGRHHVHPVERRPTPASGSISRSTTRANVDLPLPLSPTTATVWRRGTSRSTPSSATIPGRGTPRRRAPTPWGSGNRLRRPRTVSSTSSAAHGRRPGLHPRPRRAAHRNGRHDPPTPPPTARSRRTCRRPRSWTGTRPAPPCTAPAPPRAPCARSARRSPTRRPGCPAGRCSR